MKSIEQFIFDKYLSQQSKAEKYKIDASNYIDWAQIAVKEAQRWIPVEEEEPEANPEEPGWSLEVICKLASGSHEILQFNVKNKTFENANYIFESGEITHWRPLERRL